MKQKYMYLPFNSGATIETDCKTKYWFVAGNQLCERLIPAGTLARIPLNAPNGFPIETQVQVENGQSWKRVSLRLAIECFGKVYLRDLGDDCEITMAAQDVPVEGWGKGSYFEDVAIKECLNWLNPDLDPVAYSSDLLNELHYYPFFDCYGDDFGNMHYVEIPGSDTKDGVPHVITL